MAIFENATCLISGPPASGKSFLALDLALTSARAGSDPHQPDDWFGHRVPRGGVIYLTETARETMRARVEAWCKGRGFLNADGLPFCVLSARSEATDKHDTIAAIYRAVEAMQDRHAFDVKMIVIDPLGRLLGAGDDGQLGAARAALEAQTLRQGTGALIAGVRTARKNFGEARGSDAAAADFDLAISVVNGVDRRHFWALTRAKRTDPGQLHGFEIRTAVVSDTEDGFSQSCYVNPRLFEQPRPVDCALIVNKASSLGEIADQFRQTARELRKAADDLPPAFAVAEREARARAETWEAAANALAQAHLVSQT